MVEPRNSPAFFPISNFGVGLFIPGVSRRGGFPSRGCGQWGGELEGRPRGPWPSPPGWEGLAGCGHLRFCENVSWGRGLPGLLWGCLQTWGLWGGEQTLLHSHSSEPTFLRCPWSLCPSGACHRQCQAEAGGARWCPPGNPADPLAFPRLPRVVFIGRCALPATIRNTVSESTLGASGLTDGRTVALQPGRCGSM